MANEPARSRTVLTGISSRTWEHPADRGALVALRKLKGFDAVLKAMSGLFKERAVRLVYLGSGVRADERQFATLHHLLVDVARTLDCDTVPELYVVSNPQPGDLVFFGYPAYHVGIYVSPGRIIDAQRTGTTIGYHSIWTTPSGYGRF